jgi:hypothetical protein
MEITDSSRFVMLQLNDGGVAQVVRLAGERKIELRDSVLLLALMAHTDTMTGRIHVTSQRLAEDTGSTDSEMRAGIARLKRHHLLRLIKDRDTGSRYYLLNPWVVCSGKDRAVGLAKREFMEA